MKVRDRRQEQLRDFGDLFDFSFHRNLQDDRPVDPCSNRHKGNPQSTAAFNVIADKITDKQRELLEAIKAAPYGITLDGLSEAYNVPPNAISGRVSELKRLGKIYTDGTRKTRSGCSAAVLKAI